MKRYQITGAMILTLLLGACGKEEQAPAPGEAPSMAETRSMTSSPDSAVEAGVQALKDNNLLAFLQTIAPPEALDQMREEFEAQKTNSEMSEADREQFAATMDRLTRDGAVDELMGEIEPQLAQMSAQIPMMMGFGQMMAQQAVQESTDLTPEQKAAAQETVSAAFTKLQGINFADAALARRAVEVAVETARGLDLQTMDDVEALDFEEMLAKGGQVLAGTKEIFDVYGLSLDDMLDSIQAEVVGQDGDTATVRVAYNLFGTPQTTETEMVKVDGRWYGAELIEEMNEELAEDPSS